MKVVNLTKKGATRDQRDAGVFNLPMEKRMEVEILLQFDSLPSMKEVQERTERIAEIAAGPFECGLANAAMIEGPPYVVVLLAINLRRNGVIPLAWHESGGFVEVVVVD